MRTVSSLISFSDRPKFYAMMNKAKGGGYESYSNTVLSFLDVDNIHVMQASLDTLRRVCILPSLFVMDHTSWLTSAYVQAILDGTIKDETQLAWFDKTGRLLSAVYDVVRHMAVYPSPVLVHCRHILPTQFLSCWATSQIWFPVIIYPLFLLFDVCLPYNPSSGQWWVGSHKYCLFSGMELCLNWFRALTNKDNADGTVDGFVLPDNNWLFCVDWERMAFLWPSVPQAVR